MDWVQMFLDFIGSIMWPLVIVIGVVVFRGPIGKLINEVDEAVFPGGSLRRRGDRTIDEIGREVGDPPRPVKIDLDPSDSEEVGQPPEPSSHGGSAEPSSQLWLSAEAVPPIIPFLRNLQRDLPGLDDVRTYGPDIAVFQASRSVVLAMRLCDGVVGENSDPLLSAWFRTMAGELTDLAEAVRDGRTGMSISGALKYSVTVSSFLEELALQLEKFTDSLGQQ